jgi:hypothetical protein
MARKHDEQTAKPTNDAYTGMLALSFLALLIGSTFLYLQINQYDDKKPPELLRKAEGAPPPLPEVGGDKGGGGGEDKDKDKDKDKDMDKDKDKDMDKDKDKDKDKQ